MLGLRKRKSVEDMLADLAPLGIGLAPGRTIDELTAEWGRKEIEAKGHEMLLVALGGEIVDPKTFEHRAWISNDVWHGDAECIEDDGDYASIVGRISELASGDLKLEDVHDHVDVEAEIAWIEWTARGQKWRYDMSIDNDWLDGSIFERVNEELKAQGSMRQVCIASLGQDFLAFCCSRDVRDRLAALPGLHMRDGIMIQGQF